MAFRAHLKELSSDDPIDRCAIRALKICSALILSPRIGPELSMTILSGDMPALYFDFQGDKIECVRLVSATQMQDAASLKTMREMPPLASMLLKVEAGDQTFAIAVPLQEQRLLHGAPPGDVTEIRDLSHKVRLAEDGGTVILDA